MYRTPIENVTTEEKLRWLSDPVTRAWVDTVKQALNDVMANSSRFALGLSSADDGNVIRARAAEIRGEYNVLVRMYDMMIEGGKGGER